MLKRIGNVVCLVMHRVGIAALLLGSAQAFALDTDVELRKLMRAQYGSYSAAKEGWKADVDGTDFILKVAQQEKIKTPYGDRLYVFVAGCVANEDNRSHAASGLAGAFVLEEKNGKAELVPSSKAIATGSHGCASGDAKLMQFGPDHYYGWLYAGGWSGQGYVMLFQSVLLPRGKKIVELADINKALDSTGSAECVGKRSTCEELDFDLKIDKARGDLKVYPLIVTRTGTRGGKKVNPTTWHIDFDEKKWSYLVPKEVKERY